jgi:hypothetical protein
MKRGRGGAAILLACGVAGAAACASESEAPPRLEQMVVQAAGASNPTVAIGAEATYVAWVGQDDGEWAVLLARVDATPGGSHPESMPPPEPVRANDRPGDAAPHAQAPAKVAVGPAGEIYVVWQNNTVIEGRPFPASDLRFALSRDGGQSFEPAIYVNDDAGGAPTSHTFHDMAVAPDGTVLVSWIDGRAEAATGPEIRVARSTDGGASFGPGAVVDGESCPCCRTSLAVGPEGEVYVAWRKVFAGSVRDIVVARSRDGGRTFEPPARVHEDGWVIDGCPHVGPALAVDAAGRLHVSWFTGAAGGEGLFHATSSDGGMSFEGRVRLTPAGAVPTTRMAMAADADGATWLAWEDPEGDAPTLRLARSRDGGPPQPVESQAPGGTLPSLAAAEGRLALAWLDGEAVGLMHSIGPGAADGGRHARH